MKTSLTILVIATCLFSCSKNVDNPVAQIPEPLSYSNGNLSTGNKSINGIFAPEGYTWSEMEASNIFAGYGAYTPELFLGDDFKIPANEKWIVNKIKFYTFFQGSSPLNPEVIDIKCQIFSFLNNGNDLAATTSIFGDYTTNRLETWEDAKMYRIINQSPIATRNIYSITANIGNLELKSGHYFLVWQSKATGNLLHYYPGNTNLGVAGKTSYNAMQKDGDSWEFLENGTGNKVDLPFEVIGTKIKI